MEGGGCVWSTMPESSATHCIKYTFQASLGRRESYYFCHENRVAIKLFEEQEACSTRDGKYSKKLWSTMIDRKWKPGGYVSLPDVGTLRPAEVYDGGSHYKDCNVTCTFDDVTGMHLTYVDVGPQLKRSSTRAGKNSKSGRPFRGLFCKGPLEIATHKEDISYSKFCKWR